MEETAGDKLAQFMRKDAGFLVSQEPDTYAHLKKSGLSDPAITRIMQKARKLQNGEEKSGVEEGKRYTLKRDEDGFSVSLE